MGGRRAFQNKSATYRIARPGKVLDTDHQLSSLLLLFFLARANHGDVGALAKAKVMGGKISLDGEEVWEQATTRAEAGRPLIRRGVGLLTAQSSPAAGPSAWQPAHCELSFLNFSQHRRALHPLLQCREEFKHDRLQCTLQASWAGVSRTPTADAAVSCTLFLRYQHMMSNPPNAQIGSRVLSLRFPSLF